MKVGTYTRLLGCALLWTSAACGSRTSLLLAEDAGVTTDTPAQESTTGNSGGRAGSSTTGRAGRGGTAAAGTGGRAATGAGGRAGRAGRGGEAAEQPRGGAGGRAAPRDRDAAADSGEDEEQPSAGSGGEEAAGSGGAQAGAGGAGGELGEGGEGGEGEPAAGSGGSDAEPVDAGTEQPEPPTGDRLTALTPEQTTEICNRIESATAEGQWSEAVRGWCSRGALGTPECPASQQSCVDGPPILPVCAQTVPDCPDITIEEFVTCRTDELRAFVEYNRTITCDTPPGMPGEAEVASCVGPYQRCAPLAALAR